MTSKTQQLDEGYIKKIYQEICEIYNDINKNLFLEANHTNENAHLVFEIILRLLNSETDQTKQKKILYCMKCLVDKENEDIFYSKDLEDFIDIAIRYLESTDNNELRCYVLEVLQRITNFKEYFHIIMYKIEELQDLLDDYLKSDRVSDKAKKHSRNILNNLTKNLRRKLMLKSGMKLEDILKEEEEDDEEEEKEEDDDEQDNKK